MRHILAFENNLKKIGSYIGILLRFQFRLLSGLALTLFALLLLLINTTFQDLAGETVARFLSRAWRTEVRISGFQYKLLRQLSIAEIYIEDHHGDTLLRLSEVRVELGNIRLFRQQIDLNSLRIGQLDARLSRKPYETDFNFQFLLDYFAAAPRDSVVVVSPIRFRLGALQLQSGELTFADGLRRRGPNEFDPKHFQLSGLHFDLSQIYGSADSSSVRLRDLGFEEAGGFALKDGHLDLSLLPDRLRLADFSLATEGSVLQGQAALNFGSLADFSDFGARVRLQLQLEHGALSTADLRYFAGEAAPQLPVRLRGNISGRLNQLRSRDLLLQLGSETFVAGSINISGLPAYQSALYDIRLQDAYLPKQELLRAFPTLSLPNQLAGLSFLQMQGEVFGYPEDFVANGRFSTNLGAAESDLNIKLKGPASTYSGQLQLQQMNLAALTGDSSLGFVSLSTEMKGKGDRWENFESQLKGELQLLDYRNYRYRGISVDGYLDRQTFTGRLASTDSNAQLQFFGLADLGSQPPFFNFVAEVDFLDLQALHLTPDSLQLRGFMEVCAEGRELDSISGELNFRHLALDLNGRPLVFDEVNVVSAFDADRQRRLLFESPVGNAYLNGDFSLKALPATLDHYLHHYVRRHDQQPLPLEEQYFELDVDIAQAQSLADFVAPGRFDIGAMRGHAYFNTQGNEADLDFQLGNFRAGSTRISNLSVFGHSNDDSLYFDLYADTLWSGQTLLAQQMSLEHSLSRDTLHFGLRAMGEGPHNDLQFDGFFDFSSDTARLQFLPSQLRVYNNRWQLQQAGPVLFEGARVRVPGLGLEHAGQSVYLAGDLSTDRRDTLRLALTDVDLEQFNPVLAAVGIQLEGYANVDLQANSVLRKAAVFGDILIDGLVIDGQPLGDLVMQSAYSVDRNLADLHAELINQGDTLAYIFGTLGNLEGDQMLDLQAQLRHSPIHPVEYLLRPIFSDVSGRATADLNLKGDFRAPVLTGQVELEGARAKVDYLNQYFNFSKRILFEPNSINFEQAEISDDETGTGRLSGQITHQKFRKTRLNLQLSAKELLVLNTEPNYKDAYFGSGKLTGTASFTGPVELVDIQVRGTTDRGTRFSIPLDADASRERVDFISFVNPEESNAEAPAEAVFTPIGVNFGMNLNVTPDAEISIIFDRVAGDIIRGRGTAAIEFGVNPQGEIQMVGDYRFASGDYTFTLANIPSKRFRINEGSTIQWTGDPYDATINLVAVYRQRASVQALLTEGQLNGRRTQLNVDTYLKLTGSLMQPTINFEIKLPTLNENDGSDQLLVRIQNINNNEQELNNQVLALLVAGQFFPSDNLVSTAFLGSTGANSLTEVLSNQLNALLSQMFDNVNIGINYRSSSFGGLTDAARNDITVALNTTLFNNRVVIDGNVGNNTANLAATPGSAQNIAGEVTVEYLMTPDGNLRLKAFNKLDDRVLINRESNYRQGVGISYTENYDTFAELLVKPKRFLQDRLVRRIPWVPEKWKGDF